MINKIFLIFTIILFIFSSVSSQTHSTTLKNQEEVFVTIYNVNLGLIKDIRKLKIPRGEIELQFKDVASKIDPTTVHIKSLTFPQSLQILEQNYEYDLLSPNKLFEKYIGQEVILISVDPKTKEKREKAILLSTNQGKIYKIGQRIVINHPGRVEFPKLPENLIAQPTLVWLLKNEYSKQQKIEVSYLTEGINWKADYVAVLNKDDTKIDLTGWVTIENRSGTTYYQANLKLVAGEVQRVQPELIRRRREMVMYEAKAAPPRFEEKEFFEYHIYTLNRPTTINHNQTKQMNLLTVNEIPVKKEFIFEGKQYYYFSRYGEIEKNEKVSVYLNIANKKENNLGIPLPKGIVRVYKEDYQGQLQFIGENRIDHTPKDEKIKIKIGKAFDVVATRKQTEYKRISDKVHESSFKISIRNHKKEDIIVNVVEPVYGEWEVLESNFNYEKVDISTLKFTVPVKKDSESILKYRIRITY
ncbi:MAG: DUF4139 domain-containing protein [Candidatus Aminicenantia bacterium]